MSNISKYFNKDFSKGEILCEGDLVKIIDKKPFNKYQKDLIGKLAIIYKVHKKCRCYKLQVLGRDKLEGNFWEVGFDHSQLLLIGRGPESKQLEEQINKIKNGKGKIVKHFKGDLYMLNGIVIHSETKEYLVSYTALYGDYLTYVRPFDMFVEMIDEERAEKYNQKFRFEFVNIESKNI